jgi:hypothetical protein
MLAAAPGCLAHSHRCKGDLSTLDGVYDAYSPLLGSLELQSLAVVFKSLKPYSNIRLLDFTRGQLRQ